MADQMHDDKKKTRIIVANFKDRKDRLEILEPHGRSLVRSIAFSAEGDLLVTVGSDNRAKVWDAKGGKMIEQFAIDRPVGIYKADFIEGDRALLLSVRGPTSSHGLAVGSDGASAKAMPSWKAPIESRVCILWRAVIG